MSIFDLTHYGGTDSQCLRTGCCREYLDLKERNNRSSRR